MCSIESDMVNNAMGSRSLENPGSKPVDRKVESPAAAAASSGTRSSAGPAGG